MKLHPLTAVQNVIQYGFQLGGAGFFLGIILQNIANAPFWVMAMTTALGVMTGGGYGYLRYAVFRYTLGESNLTVKSGVFHRQEREIPLRRIQNVDIKQKFIPRLFGVAEVRFETAGGGQTEATLQLVAYDEAKRLQRKIRDRKQSDSTASEVTGTTTEEISTTDDSPTARRDQPTILFELTPRNLTLFSSITFRWGLIPFLLFGIPFVDQFFTRFITRLLQSVFRNGATSIASIQGIAVAISGFIGIVILAWILSAVLTFVQYYNFWLGQIEDELVYERGLINRYSGSIPLNKVQAITIEDNPVMRQLGYASLTIKTAGYSGGSRGQRSQRQTNPSAVPFAERERILTFLEELEGVNDISIEQPPKRSRRRYFGRYVLGIGIITILLALLNGYFYPIGELWLAPLLIGLLTPLAAHLTWIHRGHSKTADHFITRAGFWKRKTQIVPYYRIQTVITHRTIFQRRYNLGSVIADTASSVGFFNDDAIAHDIDTTAATELHEALRNRLENARQEVDINRGL
ncbi:MAG: PH domain-containing protein [Halobacteriaceae archaeon]